MADAALKKLEDQLNCPVCLDTYTNPKQLQCQHIYCQQCLRRLVERDQQGQLVLICPNCRQVTPVPANGVAGLPAAFHINNLLELQDTLKEQKKAKEGVLYCADHQERELELYCESCEQLICFQCTIAEHRSHNFKLVKDIFETHNVDIKSSLAPAKEQLLAVRRASQLVKALKKDVLDQQATLKAKMYQEKQRLIDIITARTNEHVDKLQRITDKKVRDLDSQVEQLDTIETQLSSGVDMVEETLTTGNPAKIVSMKTAIARQVKELTTSLQTDTLKPVTQADMEYFIGIEVLEVCQNYGAIGATMSPDPSMCRATGKGLKVATVMEKSSAILQSLDFKGQPLKEIIRSSECELVSDITGYRTRGSIERRGQSQYEINYQPTIIGKHQLHIKVEAQHIRGSPFTVRVTRTDLKKLGTPLRTIDGVKRPFGVAINQKGEVLVTERSGNCVFVFSNTGKNLRSFGTGHVQFNGPAGITVTSNGNILVVDSNNHRILKFSADGQFLTAVGTKGSNPLQFSEPRGVAVNKSNNKVYVVDTENSRVQILNSDLTFSSSFGKKGSGKGQFIRPFGMTCNRSGNVYVADRENYRIQVFTAEGKFLRMFGEGSVWFKGPTDIAIDGNDMVYVVDDSDHVFVFSPEGQLVTSFGRSGRGKGEFDTPLGMVVDSSGVVYVCDYLNNRVQLF